VRMTQAIEVTRKGLITCYVLAALYFASGYCRFFASMESPTVLLLFLYLCVAPLAIGIVGAILLFKRYRAPAYVWLASLYWFVTSAGELLEGGRPVPSTAFMVVMLVASVSFMLLTAYEWRIGSTIGQSTRTE